MLRRPVLGTVTVLAALAGAASTAHAADRCSAPTKGWERAAPEAVGLDAEKLRAAVDLASSKRSFSVRVYRRGCLVAEDALAPLNRGAQYESWSMAKSVTSMVFGRAMTLGLVSPDDVVGALIPEADAAHGAIRLRDLLTMSSGLEWNGLRDYDLAMPDRLHDALVTPVVRKPGTWFEYSQSGPALLAEAVARAVGEDLQTFAQRELFGPIGIRPGTWRWVRDSKGHTQGFFGVNMVPDDFGRLGELLRREGVWDGRRLLSRAYLREAVAPSATSGCYAWMFWVNAGTSCVGVRITDRTTTHERMLPGLPADLYQFNGLFDQRVTIFPSQDLVFVRTGTFGGDGVAVADGSSWEIPVYKALLAAVTDGPVERTAEKDPAARADRPDPDFGFQTALLEPQKYTQPFVAPPLPPAGPRRARALRLRLATARQSRTGVVTLRATCPAAAREACEGTATLDDGRSVAFAVQPGRTTLLRFRIARLRTATTLVARATVTDAAGGTVTEVPVAVREPAVSR